MVLPQNIKLTIAYDGTDYHGWQIQPGLKTVQGTLCEAASTLLRQDVHIQGASRTDTGVHAQGQVGLLKAVTTIPMSELHWALNDHLPKDIVVRAAEWVPDSFDPTKGAQRKHYRYTLCIGRLRPVRQIRFCWHYPSELIVETMQAAARHLIGKQDFRTFAASVESKRNTVRTLYRCDVISYMEAGSAFIRVDVEGDGFLHHMVRILVGTLVDVSRGYLRPDQIPEVLAAQDRSAAGHLAPACGLSLEYVVYDKDERIIT
jgi:tRNA pseudouridine38-40 synthase